MQYKSVILLLGKAVLYITQGT